MRFHLLFVVILIVAFVSAPAAWAQAPQAADLNALRAQLDALKADYEKKVQDLQKQIEDMQAQLLKLPEPEAVVAPQAPPTVPTSLGALNPAISVVGNFLGRVDNQKAFLDDGITRIDNNLNFRE